MRILKNRENEVRAGWKILSVMSSFFASAIIFVLIFLICYAAFIIFTEGHILPNNLVKSITSGYLFKFSASILQCIAMIIAVILFWKIYDKKPIKNLGLTSLSTGIKDLIFGLIFGAGSISIVFLIFVLTKQITVINGFTNPNFTWMLLYDFIIMIFVGFNEELFSRGYCMTVLKKSNILVVYLVPNVIFALMHSLNPNVGVLPLVNVFLVGLLFSFMFLRRGNLWMPIGYHITWNYFQGSVFGMPVSGMDLHGLLTSELNTENIFNGGRFGPEGGLVVTILILLSFIPFLISKQNGTTVSSSTLKT